MLFFFAFGEILLFSDSHRAVGEILIKYVFNPPGGDALSPQLFFFGVFVVGPDPWGSFPDEARHPKPPPYDPPRIEEDWNSKL